MSILVHQRLVESAKQAIDAVFGDQSVPVSQTRESLEELQSDIEIKLGGLEADEDP